MKITDDKTRAFEMTIDVDASPEDVWQALTDAGELVRWFPLQARVTPGRGGTMHWSWGDAWEWETRIDGWEPPRLLRLVQDRYEPYDADGRPLAEGQAQPRRVALEITLDAHAGRTRVRLVHSGFDRGGAWDDEFDGISTGWQFELRSLRFYLQHHRGRDRHAGWARLAIPAPRDHVWRRLVGTGGFAIDAPALQEGAPYSVTTPEGERFSGTILLALPDREFSGTVRELENGVFRLGTHRAGGQTGVMVWLATYGAGKDRVSAFGRAAQEAIDRLFAAKPSY